MRSAFYLSHLLFIIIVVCYMISLGITRAVTQSGMIFDAYVIAIALYCMPCLLKKANIKLLALIVFWVAFFIFYTLRFLFFMDFSDGGGVYEFSRSIRFCLYLICFLIALNYFEREEVNVVKKETMILFIYTLLTLFFISYLVRYFFLGSARPWLFAENNFEVPVVATLYCFLVLLKGSKSFQYLSVFISMFSMSKSGMLEILIAYLRLNKIKNLQQMLVLGLAFLFILSLTGYLFLDRIASSGGKIDRFLFLSVFYDEFKDFNAFELLFGKGVAAELQSNSCSQLLFWVNSIFGSASTYCNATVFHSFYLRMFYEFGVVGILSIILSWCFLLFRAFGRHLGLTIFLIISFCSLSISGFSNSIVMWGAFIGLYICKELKASSVK